MKIPILVYMYVQKKGMELANPLKTKRVFFGWLSASDSNPGPTAKGAPVPDLLLLTRHAEPGVNKLLALFPKFISDHRRGRSSEQMTSTAFEEPSFY